MSGFNIYGDNNRAAGRDYHEHAAPDVCPYCENRLLTAGREWCRHCEDEYNEIQRIEAIRQVTEKKLGGLLMVIFCIFIASALSLHYGPDDWTKYAGGAAILCLIALGIVVNALQNHSKKNFYS